MSWVRLIIYLMDYSIHPTEYQRDYRRQYDGDLEYFTINFDEDSWIKFAKYLAYFKNYIDCLDYITYQEIEGKNLQKKM